MLLYFILGILFISLGIPILEALSSIVTSWSQYIVYIFAFKIYNLKQKMNIDQDQDDSENKIIGFTSAIGEVISNGQEFQEDQEE